MSERITLSVRISPELNKLFKITLATKGEKAQDVLQKAIENYIKEKEA